jgi:hypothetical protein
MDPQRNPTLLDKFLVYVPQPHYFFFCRECKVVLIPSRFRTHFYEKHSLPLPICRGLLAAWKIHHARYPLSVQTEGQYRSWLPPPIPQPPIPFLPIHRGLQCRSTDSITGQGCTAIFLTLPLLKTHLRTKHEWINKVKPGRPGKYQRYQDPDTVSQPWETDVPCQKIGSTSNIGAPFRVIT